jgi:RNA polymerase sigma factor (sigma-70 family)
VAEITEFAAIGRDRAVLRLVIIVLIFVDPVSGGCELPFNFDTLCDRELPSQVGTVCIVAGNIRYVQMLARRHGQKKHLTLEDLIQEGMIGLLRATDLFDPERGFRFKTYATWWIEQRMQRAIADDDRLVRLPVYLHDTVKRVKRAEARLTLATGTAPTPDQLANAIGMDPERLQKLLWRVQATEVIEGDSPVGETRRSWRSRRILPIQRLRSPHIRNCRSASAVSLRH